VVNWYGQLVILYITRRDCCMADSASLGDCTYISLQIPSAYESYCCKRGCKHPCHMQHAQSWTNASQSSSIETDERLFGTTAEITQSTCCQQP